MMFTQIRNHHDSNELREGKLFERRANFWEPSYTYYAFPDGTSYKLVWLLWFHQRLLWNGNDNLAFQSWFMSRIGVTCRRSWASGLLTHESEARDFSLVTLGPYPLADNLALCCLRHLRRPHPHLPCVHVVHIRTSTGTCTCAPVIKDESIRKNAAWTHNLYCWKVLNYWITESKRGFPS